MTINNLRISELTRSVNSHASLLNFYQRENHPQKLIEAARIIKNAAKEIEELMEWMQA